MAFSSGPSSFSAEINVTPLIDVLLVLLIIFMVIVPVLPRGLESSVPQDHPSHAPALSPAIVRVLQPAPQSNPGAAPRYLVGERQTTLPGLRPALEQLFAGRADRTLFVQADRALTYGEVAPVVGQAHAAGAGPIALLAPQQH